MQRTKVRGAYTALVTPFDLSGKIDESRLLEQITRQIQVGMTGIVPVGTTGESPTLSMEEHLRVIELSVKFAGGNVEVLAGTGANSTSEAIYLTQEAEKLGVNGSLQVAPYYNKPSQQGLFSHFCAIAKETQLPIILYNIPGRCAVDITVDTVCRLTESAPNIVGIKVANGNMDYVTELRAKLGHDFTILSGDDSLTLPFISVGADGVISVASNVVPEMLAEMLRMTYVGNFTSAREVHARLYALTKSLFLEGNPVGVKSAMEQLGWDSGVVRLPLVKVQPATASAIRKELVALGLCE